MIRPAGRDTRTPPAQEVVRRSVETGRWLTPDPPTKAPDAKLMTQPWELHPFAYVNQNPAVYWDADGKEPTAEDVAAATLVIDRINEIHNAWNNIISNKEIHVTGSTADVQEWLNLVEDELRDSFLTKEVDLDDLDKFPTSPSAGHPNEITRGQTAIHFLQERWEAVDASGSELHQCPGLR